MQNDLKYQVRSREIGDIVSMMRSGRLILSPYFQRNLVWRDSHKHDFIETILHGYPFPQIFLARGPINLTTMESQTCVVDGQQRLNAIREYTGDKLRVGGKLFSDLNTDEKTAFVKYEVPVIDFDLDAGDARLKEVFKRLNRTFYSLSTIERIATEYSASEFLLTARLLCGDIATGDVAKEEIEAALDVFDPGDLPDEVEDEAVDNEFLRDPGISKEKWEWLEARAGGAFSLLVGSERIFSQYEFQRKVPLMFVLNVMCTVLGGYYSRNSKVKEYLEDYNVDFAQSESLIQKMDAVSDLIYKFSLPERSIWWNKANFFTVVCELARLDHLEEVDPISTGKNLLFFEGAPPREFQIAAREAVNNRPERLLRASVFQHLVARYGEPFVTIEELDDDPQSAVDVEVTDPSLPE
ncbi:MULTISPECIES: DUF262 domain-containing protein [unclassified Mesorhizobium]|uniref:DUF262 domain-containing protein n=1 Tax=unclassified Mesorhizobium TaxID=325217 RepID=UPI0003CEBB55|nr:MULTISPECIES: DUF262 domain-containing protein [unclassified Mesorhizobium]ESY58098.1 hypothetical protein X745_04675 [Mesorhizobium sp. LNJC374B00]ESY58945.1 hypothetical protein X744_13325 [Mesorhizobium sp. LNJC372A00]WJI79595.1 DUF262 domain-containing protein [Mesorhizobium sp. C374B]WJI86130.1 DUF262 domain-containing protein [Mesorhizobium sp. C372A]